MKKDEKLYVETIRDLQKKITENKIKTQQLCPHLQGSIFLCGCPGRFTSIVWHKFLRPETRFIGLCTCCLKVFHSANWDCGYGNCDHHSDRFEYWFNLKSGNRLSVDGVEVLGPVRTDMIDGRDGSFNDLNDLVSGVDRCKEPNDNGGLSLKDFIQKYYKPEGK